MSNLTLFEPILTSCLTLSTMSAQIKHKWSFIYTYLDISHVTLHDRLESLTCWDIYFTIQTIQSAVYLSLSQFVCLLSLRIYVCLSDSVDRVYILTQPKAFSRTGHDNEPFVVTFSCSPSFSLFHSLTQASLPQQTSPDLNARGITHVRARCHN